MYCTAPMSRRVLRRVAWKLRHASLRATCRGYVSRANRPRRQPEDSSSAGNSAETSIRNSSGRERPRDRASRRPVCSRRDLGRRFARMKTDLDEPNAFRPLARKQPQQREVDASGVGRAVERVGVRDSLRIDQRAEPPGKARFTQASGHFQTAKAASTVCETAKAPRPRAPRRCRTARITSGTMRGDGRNHLDVLMPVEVRRPQAVVADELAPAAPIPLESRRGTGRRDRRSRANSAKTPGKRPCGSSNSAG